VVGTPCLRFTPSTAPGHAIMSIVNDSTRTVSDATHVEVSGAVSGRYVIRDRGPAGELVIAPDTSWEAINERAGGRELTRDEWQAFLEEHGPYMLPADGEG